MNEDKAIKLFNYGEENAKNFKHIADPVVKYSTITDEENMKTISYLSSVDMAIGAAVMRNKHILIGVAIGAVGTGLAFVIGNKIKKRRNTKKEETEEILEEVVITQPESLEMKIEEHGRIVRKKTDEDNLSAIITEVIENGKVH